MSSRKPGEKGRTVFNPQESFALSVSWILRNSEVAEGMLKDGLQSCAKATQRDTPCVPLYFFRKAYDQAPAEDYSKTILTIGDHPHYEKVFKSLDMGVPLAFNKIKLSTAGIDSEPLAWGPTTSFDDAKKSQLGFAPVVLSLTEFYLDSRSFFEHADSPDYLSVYGVVMQGHRSLKAVSRCLGTPTDRIMDTVLTPFLHVERATHASLEFRQTHAANAAQGWAFMEFALSISPSLEEAKIKANGVFSNLKAICCLVFCDGEKLHVECSMAWPADLNFLGDIGIQAGQLFVFSALKVELPGSFPECVKLYQSEPGTLFQRAADGTMYWAGYCMHPLVSALTPDATCE